ncbi:hypothetical protein NQZ68_038015 [Dissostichus eleginoides]|nr:hypothetical protein NQZ68_038015 [Dissostichus eleginoides]
MERDRIAVRENNKTQNREFRKLSGKPHLQSASWRTSDSSFKDKECNHTHHIKSWLVVGMGPKRSAALLDYLVSCVHQAQIPIFFLIIQCHRGRVAARIPL